MNPEISVITATYNAASKIRCLFNSLDLQTFRNFEWIVMDGLSSDGTTEIVKELADEHGWIYFSSEADFGVYHAINRAIDRARGKYYVVAGADDVFSAESLMEYSNVIVREECDVVLAQVTRSGQTTGGFYPSRSWISPTKVFPGSHSLGMLFKKELHERFGMYSRQFPLLADSYFLKLLLQARSVKFVEADFVAGTFGEEGMSTLNKLQVLCETWQIQMLTERSHLFQTLLFFGKVCMRYPSVRNEMLRRAAKSQGKCSG